jgi:hypothetical protein
MRYWMTPCAIAARMVPASRAAVTAMMPGG